jgi:pimeloyl-ACP methyl ester carboxylesterase
MPQKDEMKTRLFLIIAPAAVAIAAILYFPWPGYNPSINEAAAEIPLRGTIPTVDVTNRTLEYYYYVPPDSIGVPQRPVLILVPGLSGSGRLFVLGRWRKFARENGFTIISPSFRFNSEDWQKQKSYQFPAIWSGQAMLDILDSVGKIHPIDKYSLYLFGHSAGAQYVHRFALLHPERCIAVAAHAPGGITYPDRFVPVKFLLTVGQDDKDRIEGTRHFADSCRTFNIAVDYKEYPGVGHALCDDAVFRSQELFVKEKNRK